MELFSFVVMEEVVAVVMVAVNWVAKASGARGVNVAVLPLTFIVPAIGVPGEAVGASVKLAVESVTPFIASEKVADSEELADTLSALFAGLMADTVGGDAAIKFGEQQFLLHRTTCTRHAGERIDGNGGGVDELTLD